MKKLLLSLAVVLVTAFYVNAQSFTLTWDGEVLGDTITLFPDTVGAQTITFHAILNNNSNADANIRLARNEVSMVGLSYSDFCWGDQCWPPAVDTSGVLPVIAGGSTEEGDFSAYYHVENSIGISIIDYTFYNNDNPDENVKIVVKFDTRPAAIDENILNNMSVSDIYPNPAENFVNINYVIPAEVETASVKIVNILGSIVKEQQINTGSNKVSMDVSDLNGGIYFYSLVINGEIYSTKKMIIR